MYDTVDKENCYKGEPTTNLATDSPSDVGGWGGYYLLIDSAIKSFNLRVNDGGAGSAWKSFYWNVSSYIGQYITITANYNFVTESNCNFQHITVGQGNTGPYPIHIAGSDEIDRLTVSSKTSQQITWSGVINATGIVGFTVWLADASVGAYTICNVSNVQIEAKSHKTPFINGTRSATQGLKDLTNTTEIDLSNVSFDANAQMLWDGTDDTMAIADYTTHKPGQPFSYEIVFKPLGGGTSYDKMLIGKPGWHTGIMYQYSYIWFRTRYGSPAFYDTGTVNVIQGNYYHVVATYTSGTSMKLYVNGVLVADNNSIPSALVDIGNTLNIGGSSVNYSSYVEIPAAKTYNRALTQTEVTQNYNSYKSRFNLA